MVMIHDSGDSLVIRRGLEMLAFACNQFRAQEPGNNQQIVEFACTRFKAEYPIFDKHRCRVFADVHQMVDNV
ncbi:hypothetical protein C5167_016609 [Papaver somniferum]|nr:hypothetical protein C5167_016609 [Papaver somniferum]